MQRVGSGEDSHTRYWQAYEDTKFINIAGQVNHLKPIIHIKFKLPENAQPTRVGYWGGAYWQIVISTPAETRSGNRENLLGKIMQFIRLLNPFNYRRTFILPVEQGRTHGRIGERGYS